MILIVGSCVAALIAGYAIDYDTGSHARALDCIPAGSAQHPVGSGLYGRRVQTPKDAKPWWLAVGLVEAVTIAVAFVVSASARRKS